MSQDNFAFLTNPQITYYRFPNGKEIWYYESSGSYVERKQDGSIEIKHAPCRCVMNAKPHIKVNQ